MFDKMKNYNRAVMDFILSIKMNCTNVFFRPYSRFSEALEQVTAAQQFNLYRSSIGACLYAVGYPVQILYIDTSIRIVCVQQNGVK